MVNIKRGIVIAVLAYVGSFVIGLLTASLVGFEPAVGSDIPTTVWLFGIISTIVIMTISTVYYFKDKNIKPSSKEGLQFGFIVFVVSFIIDLSIVIPSVLLSNVSSDIIHYYINPFFWIIVLALFVTCMFVGQYLGEGSEKRKKTAKKAANLKISKKRLSVKKSSKRKSKKKKRKGNKK